MTEAINKNELTDRLAIIQNMILEGRRTTARWSWTGVLWGIAYLAAMVWSTWGSYRVWAWPACVLVAGVLTVARKRGDGEVGPETTLGRAIGSVWLALGITVVLLIPALGVAGRLNDVHLFVSVICAFLGMANAAAGLMLRWKIQLACAVVWWVVAVAANFGSVNQAVILFLIAIVLCMIGFGIYGMVLEARGKRRAASHA